MRKLSGKNCKSKWQTLCAAYAPDCDLSFGLKSGRNRGEKREVVLAGAKEGVGGVVGACMQDWDLTAAQVSFKKLE